MPYRLNHLDYILGYDFAQTHLLRSFFKVPKPLSLTVTLYREPLEDSPVAPGMPNRNMQLKLLSIFLLSTLKSPKIKVLTKAQKKHNQIDQRSNLVPQLVLKNATDIEYLLLNFLVRVNWRSILLNARVAYDKPSNKTIFRFKYPAASLGEIYGFDRIFNSAVKELFFSFSIELKGAWTAKDFIQLKFYG